ncbi:MAG TPA: hypothetical protein VMM12_07755 [Longimicrobiales bacterium]|nr:hypothetical protein [Longimicrobiales bacterium]
MRRAATLACAAAFVATAPPSPTTAQGTVEIQEWDVPWENSRPRDPDVAPDGRVWFVGQTADYAAVLDPRTGEFERHDLPDGAGPHNLIVGKDGIIWYAGNRARHIGRLDPASGEIRRFEMPDAAARDPHTLVWGRDGQIWFTVQGGNKVGRFHPGTGQVRVVDAPMERARPYGIVQAPDGEIWVAAFGTNRLLRVDERTMVVREVELPRADARPRRLQPTSDGRIWYVDYAGGRLGVYDPAADGFEEWELPGGAEARPYAMAVDERDRLWMVETGPRGEPNTLVGFDPASERFIHATDIPSGGGTVRHMVYHAPTRSIWFGTDTNTIGVARLPR